MSSQLEVAPKEQATQSTCRHHWIIETSAGPTSRGVCKFCGTEKEFYNYLTPPWWKEGIPTPMGSFDVFPLEPDEVWED